MANKLIPSNINGVELHPFATQRTKSLLSSLERLGVEGINVEPTSAIDRLRLLASFIASKIVPEGDLQPVEADPAE